MFLGHYGVALALKRKEPKVSLGTLFIAAQLVDMLWGAFLLLGWEHVRILPDDNPLLVLQFYDYPISHSLVGAFAWGAVAAALYYSWPTRDTTRHWQAAVLVGRGGGLALAAGSRRARARPAAGRQRLAEARVSGSGGTSA